jgi:periplasmic divalent cation tolerance protein
MSALPTVAAITTTLPTREQALAIARAVVEARLAACAQVDADPLTSVYRWQGAVCEEGEWRLVLKTRQALEPALRERVAGLHPYAVPQWVCQVANVSADYAAWVDAVTGPPGVTS